MSFFVLQEKEELAAKLRDETQLRQNLEEELRETEEELEELRAESDEEKTLLLQRIKDLEEELEQLKSLMESSLDKATREKAEALMAAARAKEQALSEAERQRIAQLKKVQGLLSKVQREGTLYIQGEAPPSCLCKHTRQVPLLLQLTILHHQRREGCWERPNGASATSFCRIISSPITKIKKPSRNRRQSR